MAVLGVDQWRQTTMLIQTESGKRGTGFLVWRSIDENSGKIFLVTNKHVLAATREVRLTDQDIEFDFNVRKEDGSITILKAIGSLNRGSPDDIRWEEHSEPDVDVMAFDITTLWNLVPNVHQKFVNYEWFGDRAKCEELDVSQADDVLVFGYPLGLRHRDTNFPLVRQGILATQVGETFEDEIEEEVGLTKNRRKRIVRGFLIDGATIPGSSGSPVVLKPVPGRMIKGAWSMGGTQPILLGLMAESMYIPNTDRKFYTESYTGLGLAFDAETIRETIELFFR